MSLYIEQGRFGEFVTEILEAEAKRRKELREKEDEEKWWNLYLHSYSDKSYTAWKEEVTSAAEARQKPGNDENTTNEDVDAIIKRLFKH